MKTGAFTFLALIVFAASAQSAGFKNPARIEGTQFLYRSSEPLGKAQVLKKMKIAEVLIFKNSTKKNEVEQEIEELQEVGYTSEQIHHIPMEWKKIDIKKACVRTIQALQILVRAEQSRRSTLVHCTLGEDRTGMVSGLVSMLFSKSTVRETFENELCANGYSDGNPDKSAYVVFEIERGLSRLFFALGKKIEKGELTVDRLDANICDDLSLDQTHILSCTRSL